MSKARRLHRTRGTLSRNVRQPPGTLVAAHGASSSIIHTIAFGPDRVDELTIDKPQQLATILGKQPVVWVNVDGLGDVEVLRQLGEILGIHPLALEDVVDTSQRPKLDTYDQRLFLVLRMAVQRGEALHLEQFSLLIGPNFVATFQEAPGDCLDELRDRIRRNRGRIRASGPAYLGYAIVDAVIDGYFLILERYGDELELLESRILAEPRPEFIGRLFEIKRELLAIRRAVWPMRDVASAMTHESTVLDADVRTYSRDANDHASRIIDLVESFRELANSMVDVYLANVNQRMNEVMKVLTIISTIFMPLGFIASFYGMNFTDSPYNMPELHLRFGYFGVIAAMLITLGFLILWFRRRGWLRRQPDAFTLARRASGEPISANSDSPSGSITAVAPATESSSRPPRTTS